MTNTEKLIENIMTRLNREVLISKILDEKADEEFINHLTEEWIELMNKSLEKYQ